VGPTHPRIERRLTRWHSVATAIVATLATVPRVRRGSRRRSSIVAAHCWRCGRFRRRIIRADTGNRAASLCLVVIVDVVGPVRVAVGAKQRFSSRCQLLTIRAGPATRMIVVRTTRKTGSAIRVAVSIASTSVGAVRVVAWAPAPAAHPRIIAVAASAVVVAGFVATSVEHEAFVGDDAHTAGRLLQHRRAPIAG